MLMWCSWCARVMLIVVLRCDACGVLMCDACAHCGAGVMLVMCSCV